MSKRSFLNQEIFDEIQKSVKYQTESTSRIYDCKDQDTLSIFSKELTNNMINEYHLQLKEREQYHIPTTSAGDFPTRNIRSALVKSKIKDDGLLPKGRAYLTKVNEGQGNFIDEDKYNRQKEAVENKISNVFQWVKENEETDPNMYELMDIFITAGKFEGDLSQDTIDQLTYLKEKRMDDLENRVGINKEDDLYKFSNEVCENTLQGMPTTYSNEVKEYICKLAGINTYIAQMKREDKNFSYDNKYEFETLADLKEKAEEIQTMLPSSCTKIFDTLGNEFKTKDGFLSELKSMTVEEPKEITTVEIKKTIEIEDMAK